MQCYHCGNTIPTGMRRCPSCGHAASRMIYVHLCGVIGGILGSLIGFTLINLPAALVGGLLGIGRAGSVSGLSARPTWRNTMNAKSHARSGFSI